MRYVIIAVLAVLAVCGCTSTLSGEGLVVSLQADPSMVFSESSTTLHADIDNRNDRTLNNVFFELFDTGMLNSGGCSRTFDRLLPYEFQTVSCKLGAPQIVEQSINTEVSSLVSFETDFSANQVFEIMDENEYQRRAAIGNFQLRPSSYIYNDKNVMIEVGFSEQPPLVIRPDKKYFVYFTIKNIGNGFISQISPGDFFAESVGRTNIIECPAQTVLSPNGKEFPRIACEIKATPDYISLGGFRSSEILIVLHYTYELRNSLQINIIR